MEDSVLKSLNFKKKFFFFIFYLRGRETDQSPWCTPQMPAVARAGRPGAGN